MVMYTQTEHKYKNNLNLYLESFLRKVAHLEISGVIFLMNAVLNLKKQVEYGCTQVANVFKYMKDFYVQFYATSCNPKLHIYM